MEKSARFSPLSPMCALVFPLSGWSRGHGGIQVFEFGAVIPAPPWEKAKKNYSVNAPHILMLDIILLFMLLSEYPGSFRDSHINESKRGLTCLLY
jgi:hypothetical protein